MSRAPSEITSVVGCSELFSVPTSKSVFPDSSAAPVSWADSTFGVVSSDALVSSASVSKAVSDIVSSYLPISILPDPSSIAESIMVTVSTDSSSVVTVSATELTLVTDYSESVFVFTSPDPDSVVISCSSDSTKP